MKRWWQDLAAVLIVPVFVVFVVFVGLILAGLVGCIR